MRFKGQNEDAASNSVVVSERSKEKKRKKKNKIKNEKLRTRTAAKRVTRTAGVNWFYQSATAERLDRRGGMRGMRSRESEDAAPGGRHLIGRSEFYGRRGKFLIVLRGPLRGIKPRRQEHIQRTEEPVKFTVEKKRFSTRNFGYELDRVR
ncbi:hypothetical protein PUN28_017146 [Cardiocondyla obscurior]|uniref:Uncharacterized protein n=1 Tax=Cardiocondyla obscurior TaxID=286306 RepID=A0AAW2EN73_9HYME